MGPGEPVPHSVCSGLFTVTLSDHRLYHGICAASTLMIYRSPTERIGLCHSCDNRGEGVLRDRQTMQLRAGDDTSNRRTFGGAVNDTCLDQASKCHSMDRGHGYKPQLTAAILCALVPPDPRRPPPDDLPTSLPLTASPDGSLQRYYVVTTKLQGAQSASN